MAKPKPKRTPAPSPTGYVLAPHRFDPEHHAGKLTPWKPGDPVACGEVYLPTAELRRQYGAECRRLQVDTLANHVLAGPTLATRQARMAQMPRQVRELVKARVWELWRERRPVTIEGSYKAEVND